jgi:hypothetical protein
MAKGQSEINAAAGRGAGVGGQPPKSRANTGSVGNESKADMKGALDGKPTDKNPLKGAISELKSQHPHGHMDHGPHHGDMSHVRHKPMKLS